MTISFDEPFALAALALLAPLAVWAVVRQERARRAALGRFGEPDLLGRSSPLPRRRERVVRWTLRLSAALLALVALARPQLGDRPASLARTGRDVLVLLDLSRSMNVADAGSSRLAEAKRVATAVTAASPGDRLGLVVFGGSAFLQLPLTPDRATFRQFLDAASSDDLGDPATDISAALAAASKSFEHEGDHGYRAVLLLTDGEGVEGDLGRETAGLRGADIPVFAVGVGTTAGGPVPADSSEAPEPYHRDHIGRVVVSRLEEGDLRKVAAATGGAYARWNDGASLDRLTEQLSSLASRPLPAQETVVRADRFQLPLALAVLLLLVEAALPRASLRGAAGKNARRVVLAAFFAALALTACSAAGREARRGDRAYAEGRWEDARAAYQRAAARDASPAYTLAEGSALYRLERYEEAARSFADAADRARGRLQQQSWYNLGNAWVRAAEEKPGDEEPLLRAISAYENALVLDPSDADAKWNLELALRRLDQDRASGGSSGRAGRADYGRGNQNVPGYEGNPDAAVGAMAGGGFGSAEGESVEELSEAEARRLLEAVEREQLSSHEGRPSRRGPRGEKDW